MNATVVVAAVSGAVAVRKRRASTRRRPASAPEPVAVPAQRRDGIDELGLRVDDLVEAEHDAHDARLFAALGCEPAPRKPKGRR